MDNYGYDDLILLVFDDLVTLTQVEIGLSQYDGDIAVVAYTGSTAGITPGTTIVGHTAATLSCVNGWLLIGSSADVVTGASTPINAGKRQFELVDPKCMQLAAWRRFGWKRARINARPAQSLPFLNR